MTSTAPASLSTVQRSRKVIQKVYAVETPEGVGAVVRRSIGSSALRNLSPFLMLDYAVIKEGAFFGDHPHRGIVTVSLSLAGKAEHEDSAGHRGTLETGDLQHAEIPVHRDAQGNKLPDPEGLQLWIDLPEKNKMDPPSYQEYKHADIPYAYGKDWSIKVIAGASHGVSSPIRSVENGSCEYYQVKLEQPGVRVFQPIPAGFTAFVLLFGPAPIRIGEAAEVYEMYHTMVLDASDAEANGVWVEHAGTKADEVAHFVVIAGQPLKQNVVQHGPFVMTSRQAIVDTIRDLQMGINGFEGAPGWRSSIARH